VRVNFEVESALLSDPKFYKATEVLFTSDPGDFGVRRPDDGNLDVTVVRLAGVGESFKGLNAARELPLIDPKTKAFVVGHPRGSGLQISLHDSVLLDIDDEERLLHYRTPTDPGNSGSPVFNRNWEVIAVHHGGSAAMPRLRGEGSYEANEGVALSAVRRKLNS
jgi:V8-like Glu-specific endopeptidase